MFGECELFETLFREPILTVELVPALPMPPDAAEKG